MQNWQKNDTVIISPIGFWFAFRIEDEYLHIVR